MSDFSDLHGLKIGCVRYLNARPLIEPYLGPVVLDHPAVLAGALVRGELDVALVPVFEALRHPEFPIVDGVSISSRGAVWSVFVAYKGDRSGIRAVSLDSASLTSANLCKVIFAEWGGSTPEYLPEPASEGAARLLIGNQAIEFRERHGDELQYLDFGEEWSLQTGLPFVYAVWLMRPEVSNPERVAAAFRGIACQGQADVAGIVTRNPEYQAEFATRYLTQHIRFGLGVPEKQGMEQFRTLLRKHGLLDADDMALRFF